MPVNPTPAEGVVVPLEPTDAMLMAARGLIMSLSFGVPNYRTSLANVARSGFYGEHWQHILTDEERQMTGPITKGQRAELIYRAMIAARPAAPTQSAAQTGEVTRDWLVSVIQQHTFAQDAADMILAALSQPEPSHD